MSYKRYIKVMFVFILCLTLFSCSGNTIDNNEQVDEQDNAAGAEEDGTTEVGNTYTTSPTELLQPEDLHYLGAFRLPDGEVPNSWGWADGAMTYYPRGETDGLVGTLFAVGNEPRDYVSEISIPLPMNSKNLADLNTATTIQAFANVSGGLFDVLVNTGAPEIGLEYLNNSAIGEKIHLSWGANLQGAGTDEDVASHGWFDLNLSSPNIVGAWYIGNQAAYSVNDYIFEIPAEWADIHVRSRYLATGRFKDGGLGGKGPSLFAYAPWQYGNPPSSGTKLNEITLLKYDSTLASSEEDYNTNRIVNYSCADAWKGGAWVTVGSKSAVIFIGTKSTGNYYWYGYLNNDYKTLPCVEEDETSFITCRNSDRSPCSVEYFTECDSHTSDKGWWSSAFNAQIIFYDPANLADVAAGNMESYAPQPYAMLNIDDVLYLSDVTEDVFFTNGSGNQRKNRVNAVAYDRERNYLYAMEPFADGAKSVIHVWKINE